MGVMLALRRDYGNKINPCRMLVRLGWHTLQNMVKNRATIGSGPYTLLSGRPVQTVRIQIYYGPEWNRLYMACAQQSEM